MVNGDAEYNLILTDSYLNSNEVILKAQLHISLTEMENNKVNVSKYNESNLVLNIVPLKDYCKTYIEGTPESSSKLYLNNSTM